MKNILFSLLLMVPLISIAQDSTKRKSPEIWIPATTVRVYPIPESEEGRAQTAYGHINKYDTVLCKYKFVGDTTVHIGWKVFYRKNGYWMDDKTTMQVFFNMQRRRIDYVSSYAIIEY
jgi:hypothetical protein